MMRRLLIAAMVLPVAFVATTLVALEGSEVVVLHTGLSRAEPRATRVWIADYDGSPWIESASPAREFYRDIVADPTVQLMRRGELSKYRAVPVEGREGHELIRSLLRQRYGWADVWIGLLADTSQSIAIRLEPIDPGAAAS
jgi:hypothetical protein